MDEYRQRKELFISNLNGTTLFETSSLILTACATFFLHQIIRSSSHKTSFRNYAIEHLIFVIPIIFVCTILSSLSSIFHVIIWSIGLSIYIFKKSIPNKVSSKINENYSYLIEAFRGQMLVQTCICVLAVDFPIFPRRFAKTENFGYSLMDFGVGLFALSHGMVSSDARNKKTNIKELFLENIILFILGFVRLFALKCFSYAEHITEYGVHWNFFLTLCFMKIIGYYLLKLFNKSMPLIIILLLFIHEKLLLNYFQYDKYLLSTNNSRTNFIDANREGIFSLPGYVCLYLCGVFLGKFIIYYENRKEYIKMIITFSISTIVLCMISNDASRKLCNSSYILSTLGMACLDLTALCFIQLLLIQKGLSFQSILLKNVNKLGLDIFLFANVLTGIINLNLNTIDTSDTNALVVLMAYMFIVTLFGYYSPSIIKLILKQLRLIK